MQQMEEEVNEDDDENHVEVQDRCLKKLEVQMEKPVIFAIILNTLVLGFQADQPELWIWEPISTLFLAFFVFELVVRLAVYRWSFFFNEDKKWNIFDFVVVSLGVLDLVGGLVFKAIGVGKSNDENNGGQYSKLVMMARVIRILRVLRLFSAHRFPELFKLAQGLIGSMQTVGWFLLLFLMLISTCALFTTNLIGKSLELFEEEDQAFLFLKFGSMGRSMQTLFIFLTFDDWSTPARMVNKTLPYMQLFWMMYIVFGGLWFVSLLTGLMAGKITEARTGVAQDQTEALAAELRERIDSLKSVFLQADSSEDGTVGRAEFEEMMQIPEIVEKMEKLDIHLMQNECFQIFDCLDRNRDGSLSWDEFRDGLIQLSKPWTSKDVMWLEGSVAKLDRTLKLAGVNEKATGMSASEWDRNLDRVHARACLIQDKVSMLEAEVQEFFDDMGYFTYK